MIVFFVNILTIVLLFAYIAYELFLSIKKNSSKLFHSFLFLLTGLHFLISFVSIYFLDKKNLDIDSVRFYENSLNATNWFDLFNLGSDFVSFLIYPLVKLNISIKVLFLVFATISYKGFLKLIDILKLDNIKNISFVFLFFYLMPSLHFWTGMIGKEALLFFIMVLLLEKIKSKLLDFRLLVLFVLVFLLRPHLFFCLLLSFWVLFLIDEKVKNSFKIKSALLFFLFLIVLIPISMRYFLNINNFNIGCVKMYFNDLIAIMKNNGGSSIDLVKTNIITRIGYLLFMPLPFIYELKNNMQFMASIENGFFLIGMLFTLFYLFKSEREILILSRELKFILIATICSTLLFASYLYNLGIGNRMRVMILPYLFYFFIEISKKIKDNELSD